MPGVQHIFLRVPAGVRSWEYKFSVYDHTSLLWNMDYIDMAMNGWMDESANE